MARPTNHSFEKAQRERAKTAKREAKKAARQAAAEAKKDADPSNIQETEATPETAADSVVDPPRDLTPK